MCGARSRSFAGDPVDPDVGRLEDVVVDRDQPVEVAGRRVPSSQLSDHHVLDLLERADAVGPALAAEAALLVAAARRVGAEQRSVFTLTAPVRSRRATLVAAATSAPYTCADRP